MRKLFTNLNFATRQFSCLFILLCAIVSFSTKAQVQVQIMVDDDGVPFTSISNHTTWESATNDLQTAIDSVYENGGGSVWVAGGTYLPTTELAADPSAPVPPGNVRHTTFVMRNGVSVTGGFEGDEATPAERPEDLFGTTNKVVLSGDIGTPADSIDNSFHVVLFPEGSNDSAILQDVYITGGQANNYQYFGYRGGGVHLRSGGILRNCVITGNFAGEAGGGVYLYQGGRIEAGEIKNNVAYSIGGGVNLNQGGLVTSVIIHSNKTSDETGGKGGGVFFASTLTEYGTVSNCFIAGNLSAKKGGGVGIYLGGHLINNLISNNEAVGNGGGVFIQEGGLILNNTIVANTADAAGGVYGDNGGEIINTVMWGNKTSQAGNTQFVRLAESTTADYCAIENGATANGITNLVILDEENSGSGTHPEFRDTISFTGLPIGESQLNEILNSDYSTELTSALLNAGTPDTTGLTLLSGDIIDNPRITKSAIDIGAYETLYYSITGTVNGGNGTIDPTGPVNLLDGENVEFIITPASGYDVALFNINGDDFSSQLVNQGSYFTNTESAVSSDLDAVVEFGIVNKINKPKEAKPTIYPTPARNELFIDGYDVQFIRIFNITGSVVKVFDSNVAFPLNISSLEKGLYFIEITGKENEKHILRFVKY